MVYILGEIISTRCFCSSNGCISLIVSCPLISCLGAKVAAKLMYASWVDVWIYGVG